MKISCIAPFAFAVAALAATDNATASDTLFIRVDSQPMPTEQVAASDTVALPADQATAPDSASQDSVVAQSDSLKAEETPAIVDSVTPAQNAKAQTPSSDSTVARPQVQVSIGSLLAAQAQSSDEKILRERNKFFLSFGLGLRYAHLSFKEYVRTRDPNKDGVWIIGDKGNSIRRKYSGYGPDISMKMGTLVSNRLAIFCNTSLSAVSSGEFKVRRYSGGHEKIRADFEMDGLRFALGGGTNFFLSTDTNSVMHGAFIGASVGIVYEAAGTDSEYDYYDDYSDDFEIAESGMVMALELGKLWRIAPEWSVGLSANGTMDGLFFNGGAATSKSWTVGLNFNIVRY